MPSRASCGCASVPVVQRRKSWRCWSTLTVVPLNPDGPLDGFVHENRQHLYTSLGGVGGALCSMVMGNDSAPVRPAVAEPPLGKPR